MALSLLTGKDVPGRRPMQKPPTELEELRALLKALTDAATSFGTANAKAMLEVAAEKRVAEVQAKLDAEVARREAVEQELAQAKSETETVRGELASVSATAQATSASLAEMERTAARIGADADTYALNSERRMREALSQLEQARKDLAAERSSRGQATTEANSARMEVERLRAQLLATPAPQQFQIDVLRDGKGLIAALDVLIGQERFRVDVGRNAAGKIKEAKRRAG